MISLFIIISGLAVGSFLNVVIYRLKLNQSIIWPPSHCPKCQARLAWYDNLPLVSFIILQAKCRHCNKKIAWQYPLVELATAIIFLILFIHFTLTVQFLVWIILASFLIVIFVYDFKYKVIPDRFSVPPMIVALLFNFALGAPPLMLLFSGLIIGAFFAAQFIISKGNWVGGGDIRLGLLMGWYLGLPLALVALLLAYISGSIIGIVLILLKHRKLDSHVPFGTFMALAIFVTLFFGDVLLNWYLGLLL